MKLLSPSDPHLDHLRQLDYGMVDEICPLGAGTPVHEPESQNPHPFDSRSGQALTSRNKGEVGVGAVSSTLGRGTRLWNPSEKWGIRGKDQTASCVLLVVRRDVASYVSTTGSIRAGRAPSSRYSVPGTGYFIPPDRLIGDELSWAAEKIAGATCFRWA